MLAISPWATNLARFNNADTGANIGHFRKKNMGGEEDGFAHFLQLPQQLAHFDARARIQTTGGFIQDEYLGIPMRQGARQTEALFHTPAEAFDKCLFL